MAEIAVRHTDLYHTFPREILVNTFLWVNLQSNQHEQ